MTEALFAINPALDRSALAARFARERRVQVRDVLTAEAARTLRRVLERETPWGFAYKGAGEPVRLTEQQVRASSESERREIANAVQRVAAAGDYAVRFGQYPILDAYLQQWHPGGPHDILLEHLNDEPFLALVREVTGIPDLRKADAQATRFAPGDFLSRHIDSHVAEGWRVAYVLNLADDSWSTDWGGYLNFFDEDGDIVAGWKPRFNALNLFAVPQPHHVSYVPPFAATSRYAITGWLRDR